MKLRCKQTCIYFLLGLLAYVTACSFYFCALSFSVESEPLRLLLPLHGGSLIHKTAFSMMFLLLFGLYQSAFKQRQPICLPDVLLSLFYALFLQIGFSKQGDGFAAAHTIGFFGLLTMLLSFACVFYCIIEWLHRHLDLLTPGPNALSEKDSGFPRFALPCFFFVCWVPFSLCGYPGSVGLDTFNQLRQMWGELPLSNNNPLLDTFVYGILYKIGYFLGHSGNAGIGFITILQLILYVFSFTYCIRTICRITGSRFWALALALFFGINPVYGALPQVVIKDTLHAVVLLVYFSYLLRMLYLPAEKHSLGKFSILFLLSALTRKAAFSYVFLAAVTLWLLLRRKQDGKGLLCAIGLAVLCFLCIENLVYPALGAEEAPSVELFSVPLQGVAYITIRHAQDMPEALLAAADRVIGLEDIYRCYSPETSDFIKGAFKEQDRELLSLYFSLVRRYPLDALKAIVDCSWKYFSPFASVQGSFRLYIMDTTPYGKNIFHQFPTLCSRIKAYTQFWSDSALLAPLVVTGTYAWMLLFTLTRVLRKKCFQPLVLFVPLLTLLVGLPFTPVNGDCRYGLPLIVGAPVLFTLVCGSSESAG